VVWQIYYLENDFSDPNILFIRNYFFTPYDIYNANYYIIIYIIIYDMSLEEIVDNMKTDKNTTHSYLHFIKNY